MFTKSKIKYKKKFVVCTLRGGGHYLSYIIVFQVIEKNRNRDSNPHH